MATFPVFHHFFVRSLDTDNKHLLWRMEVEGGDVLDFNIKVLRSESPGGPWEAVSGPFRDRDHFIDQTIPVGHRYRQLYYKLELTHVPTGEVQEAGPVTQEAEIDLYGAEIRRHLMLLHKEFTGRTCWLFPVRTYGARCPRCWDRKSQARSRSRCLDCYDTTFLRGYLAPLEIAITFDPSANNEQVTTLGKGQQNNTTARMGFYPQVKPGDVIVELENRRWRVTNVTNLEALRAVTAQELQLHEIPVRDIEMELPLDQSQILTERWFAPRRNFSNPHNEENDADTIRLLYPGARQGVRG
jgi:hypothetical protein